MLDKYIKEASEKFGVPEKVVKAVCDSACRLVKRTMRGVHANRVLSEEEFRALNPCVNFSGLGKLYIPYTKYSNIKSRRLEKVKRYHESIKESNTEIHEGPDHSEH